MVTPSVTSLLHFHQYKLFKSMVCILALFGFFWLLFKTLGYFYPNHLITLVISRPPGKRGGWELTMPTSVNIHKHPSGKHP
jgi:hypothetical protein